MNKRVLHLSYYFLIVINLLFLGGCSHTASSCLVEDLTVNHRTNPISVDENPIFGWKLVDSVQGQQQTAYHIVVSDTKENLDKEKYIWDSGKVESDASTAIPYTGEALEPETRYYWQVTIWDKDGNKAESRQEAYFETGITDDDWEGAEWICLQEEEETAIKEEDYTIQYDISMKQASNSGFVWGADKREYGKYVICAIDTTGDAFDLVLSEMEGEEVLQEYRYALGESGFDKDSFFGVSHHVRIEAGKQDIAVALDETMVAEQMLSEQKGIGQIGFWTARGAFYAYYDNLCVRNNITGECVYEESFVGNC